MRIAIAYNDSSNLAAGREIDAIAVAAGANAANDVRLACEANGWKADLFPVRQADQLRNVSADLVFNLVESDGALGNLEADAALVLENVGIPYTGSPPAVLARAQDKNRAREMLRQVGIRIPRGCPSDDDRGLSALRYPCIVKPAREHASHGLSLDSVVYSDLEAGRRADFLRDTYRQPALVEEFIAGREFNVAILGEGASVLSPAEIDFTGFPEGAPRILTFEAKWIESSPECRGSVSRKAEVEQALEDRLTRTALLAYRASGIRDYGRIDMRVGDDGDPSVIDVNPNPDLSRSAGLALAAERSGIRYERLVERLAGYAMKRAGAGRNA